MSEEQKERICFVIAPIGEEGGDIRRRSDQVLTHIIAPAAKNCGYETIRADKISEPGIITSQVIQHLLEDPLVIADITGRNPNVFYELAIRHAVRKPIVLIIQVGEPIPFDVAQSRTIQVNHHDLDSAAHCRDELVKQIQAVEKNPADVDTPLSVAIDLQPLRKSDNPLEKSSVEIIAMLQDLRSKTVERNEIASMQSTIRDLSSKIEQLSEIRRYPRIPPGMTEEILMHYRRLIDTLDIALDEKGGRAQLQEAAHIARRLGRSLSMMMMELGVPPELVEEYTTRFLRGRRPE
jgi:flagellar biosynthesis chaperone FliJ